MLCNGKWFGANDHKTSPSCFEFDGRVTYGVVSGENHHIYQEYLAGLNAVMNLLKELETKGDIQFIFVQNSYIEFGLVAYRFTSDKAYDRSRDKLVKLGGSLGRGVFDPFRCGGTTDITKWTSEAGQHWTLRPNAK